MDILKYVSELDWYQNEGKRSAYSNIFRMIITSSFLDVLTNQGVSISMLDKTTFDHNIQRLLTDPYLLENSDN